MRHKVITSGAKRALLTIVAALMISSGQASAEPVKIGVSKIVSAGAVFLAVELGYFKEQGIDPELVYFNAAQPVAVATASGDIDFASSGLTAGFYTMAGQGVLKIIGAQTHERPGYQSNAVIVSAKAYEAGLKTFNDLPGKSVGVNAVGSTTHYSLGLIAEKYGLDLSAIKVVPLQTFPNQTAALRGGQVDTIVVPSTVALPMLAKKEAHVLGYVGDETPWQIGAVFTSTKTANERADLVKRFLAAYKKGLRTFHEAFEGPTGKTTDGEKAARVLAIVSKYVEQSVDSIKPVIPYMEPDGKLNVADIENQIRWYKQNKLLAPTVNPKDVIDERYVVALPAERK